MAAQAIAPGTGRLDIVVVLAKAEGGAGKLGRHRGQAIKQSLAARNHKASPAAKDLRRAGRQVKLAAADIHPHVGVGHHQIGVPGQAEAGDIKQGRQPLVGDLDIDMFEMDRVAEVFGGAVEMLLHGGFPGCVGAIIPKRGPTGN